MLRKQGFPMNNCNIKMPDNMSGLESVQLDDDGEQLQRRQQLINFAHAQWGFNNWSWSVTKQDLDFVDFSNGKYCAGVAAFVSVTVKTFDIHRENIGYATSVAHNKGLAIWKSRKCAVTNALRETLLSFGGNVAAELIEALESNKGEAHTGTAAANGDSDCATTTPAAKPVAEVKNAINKGQTGAANSVRPPLQAPKNAGPIPAAPAPCLPPAANRPPPANAPRPPAPPGPPAPLTRPNSNVSFVLQPVMPPLYGPRLPPPGPIYPNAYYEYSAGPWHFTYEPFDRHHGNVNLNFNLPPKNLVVNGRPASVECKNACGARPSAGPEGEPLQYGPPPQNQGCWIKPTIFYDGFWTEQKVKKWVAEQVEKQFPEDSSQKSSSSSGQPDSSGSKS